MNNGLIYAFLLDSQGGGSQMDWDGIRAWHPADGFLWVHVNREDDQARLWLRQAVAEHDPAGIVGDALFAEESRPRSVEIADGLLIALRGVNLNPGQDPEDMVAIRLWISPRGCFSTGFRRLESVAELAARLQGGTGPRTPGELLTMLTSLLTDKIIDYTDHAEETISDIEHGVLETPDASVRSRLVALRRETIAVRRYLAPQREAMTRLYSESAAWLNKPDRLTLREIGDRLIRGIEDLDAVRERAAVMQEEILSRQSQEMNNRMYVLSIVAAIFLPLGFLTGLLGINVGGIPGSDNPWAFFEFTGILIAVIAVQLWIFKKKGWL